MSEISLNFIHFYSVFREMSLNVIQAFRFRVKTMNNKYIEHAVNPFYELRAPAALSAVARLGFSRLGFSDSATKSAKLCKIPQNSENNPQNSANSAKFRKNLTKISSIPQNSATFRIIPQNSEKKP